MSSPLSLTLTPAPWITVFVPCLTFKGTQTNSLPFSFCSFCPSHTGLLFSFFTFSHIRIFKQDFPITWSAFLSAREAPWLRPEGLGGSHEKEDLGECSRQRKQANCKSPEEGLNVACSGVSKKAFVARAEWKARGAQNAIGEGRGQTKCSFVVHNRVCILNASGSKLLWSRDYVVWFTAGLSK